MESIRHSESIVLPRAKSMAFNKQIFMNFDSPCMASVTTTMLSPILHCVRYHIIKTAKNDNSLQWIGQQSYGMFEAICKVYKIWHVEIYRDSYCYHKAWNQSKCKVIVKGVMSVTIVHGKLISSWIYPICSVIGLLVHIHILQQDL